MVQVKKYSSSNLYELRSDFPKLPEIRIHDNSERSLYHLFDTSKESIFGINLAKNCPFQPSHPGLNTNFQMLDYSLPRDVEQKTGWEIEFSKTLPDAILIGQNYEPFSSFEKTRTLAIRLGKFLANQGFKIWYQTRATLDLELFETLLYLEEDVQLLLPFHTLNDRIAKLIEPFCPAPNTRLKQVETLKNLGIPYEICLDSLIPGLNDSKANLFPLLESLAEKGIKRATVSFMHLPTGFRSNLNKQKQQMFSMWSAGIEFEFAGLGIRKLLNATYRKAKYAEIMAWGKEFGIKIVVDGIANPDLARKSLPDTQSITSNLKERYLALSTK
jgi:DNA repair photolyase